MRYSSKLFDLIQKQAHKHQGHFLMPHGTISATDSQTQWEEGFLNSVPYKFIQFAQFHTYLALLPKIEQTKEPVKVEVRNCSPRFMFSHRIENKTISVTDHLNNY